MQPWLLCRIKRACVCLNLKRSPFGLYVSQNQRVELPGIWQRSLSVALDTKRGGVGLQPCSPPALAAEDPRVVPSVSRAGAPWRLFPFASGRVFFFSPSFLSSPFNLLCTSGSCRRGWRLLRRGRQAGSERARAWLDAVSNWRRPGGPLGFSDRGGRPAGGRAPLTVTRRSQAAAAALLPPPPAAAALRPVHSLPSFSLRGAEVASEDHEEHFSLPFPRVRRRLPYVRVNQCETKPFFIFVLSKIIIKKFTFSRCLWRWIWPRVLPVCFCLSPRFPPPPLSGSFNCKFFGAELFPPP